LETIYTPDYALDRSFTQCLKIHKESLLTYRHYLWQNFKKDFVGSTRGSLFGVAWKFVLPVVPSSVYILLQSIGVFAKAEGMPKAMYVICGMTFYQFFADCVNNAVGKLVGGERNLITKVKLPLLVVYLSGLGQIFFDTAVRCGLIMILAIYYKYNLFYLLSMPLTLIPLLLLALSGGIFLSFYNVYYGDIANVVGIVLRYGLFASGVIFPLPTTRALGKVLSFSPIYQLVENGRSLIVTGATSHTTLYVVLVAVGLVAFLYVLKVMSVVENRIISDL
jgi:ABC-type polysaccharide/polyol phosphate export permease